MAAKPRFTPSVKVERLEKMFADYNPNVMTEAEFDDLKRSMREYGWAENVVANKRSTEKGWPATAEPVLVGGHNRVRSARAVYDDEGEWGDLNPAPVRWMDLDARDEKRLNLILNNVTGSNDPLLLEEVLRSFDQDDDLSGLGFSEAELDRILAIDEDSGTTGDGREPNEETNRTCPQCGFKWKE